MSASAHIGHLQVACPACQGASVYASSNPHRPFCSARCQGLDFSAWASEDYRVGVKGSEVELQEGLEGQDLPPGAH